MSHDVTISLGVVDYVVPMLAAGQLLRMSDVVQSAPHGWDVSVEILAIALERADQRPSRIADMTRDELFVAIRQIARLISLSISELKDE